MRDLRIAAVQFEPRDADKEYNLSRIEHLTARAAEQGAEVVSFHECSISGYSFVQTLTKPELSSLAEPVPNGPSLKRLQDLSTKYNVAILAGLFELRDEEIFNTYVCVDQGQLVAKFSKLHAFVSPHLSSGNEYCLFELRGCQCSILICYDMNLVENVRAVALQGAEILFAPHVTGCLPSPMPGRGTVNPDLWHNRKADPVSLRQELNGPKGREWLLRWLPARAYDNGLYVIFTNPIGIDGTQVRNGNAMILDPFGEILAECHALEDDLAIATCVKGRRELSGGYRYLNARRPELYQPLLTPNEGPSQTSPGWTLAQPTDASLPSHTPDSPKTS